MPVKDKICLALDVDNGSEALDVVHKLKDFVGIFKVGSQLYTSEGPEIVKQIVSSGAKIFLDLKYHDIPNTVANTARVAVRLGVSIFNIHTLGGYEMMAATASATQEEAARLGIPKPRILGVTVLTSVTPAVLSEELKINSSLRDYVVHLATTAQKAGLDGVVASPHEIRLIRESCGDKFVILTPGIRPAWAADVHDQKRVMTPREATGQGADYIVIGRPIIKADDPVFAARKLLDELNQ